MVPTTIHPGWPTGNGTWRLFKPAATPAESASNDTLRLGQRHLRGYLLGSSGTSRNTSRTKVPAKCRHSTRNNEHGAVKNSLNNAWPRDLGRANVTYVNSRMEVYYQILLPIWHSLCYLPSRHRSLLLSYHWGRSYSAHQLYEWFLYCRFRRYTPLSKQSPSDDLCNIPYTGGRDHDVSRLTGCAMPSHVMIHVAFLRHDYEGVSGFLLDAYGMMGTIHGLFPNLARQQRSSRLHGWSSTQLCPLSRKTRCDVNVFECATRRWWTCSCWHSRPSFCG